MIEWREFIPYKSDRVFAHFDRVWSRVMSV